MKFLAPALLGFVSLVTSLPQQGSGSCAYEESQSCDNWCTAFCTQNMIRGPSGMFEQVCSLNSVNDFQNIITNIFQTCCQKKVQSCKTEELCIKKIAAINYSSEEPATSTVQSKEPFSSACGFAIPSPWPSWFGIGPVIPQSNCAPPPPATTPSSTTAGIPGWPKHGGHGPVVIPKPTTR
jgi:hypothetical protein